MCAQYRFVNTSFLTVDSSLSAQLPGGEEWGLHSGIDAIWLITVQLVKLLVPDKVELTLICNP